MRIGEARAGRLAWGNSAQGYNWDGPDWRIRNNRQASPAHTTTTAHDENTQHAADAPIVITQWQHQNLAKQTGLANGARRLQLHLDDRTGHEYDLKLLAHFRT